jgi:hypothetical protein
MESAGVKPQLGWVWLSQAEREGAEAALEGVAVEGARDELGFGGIHFAYADRFFPGTSVQHTHLRYVFFVCWAYQEVIRRQPGPVFPGDILGKIQDRTGHKLIRAYGNRDNTGVIGIRILSGGASPQTKPSTIYWSALRTWNLLAPEPTLTATPPQSWVHGHWSAYSVPMKGPELDSLKTVQRLFDPLPPPPPGWGLEQGELRFDLSIPEAERIRRGWASAGNGDTLMSRLAEKGAAPPARLTSRAVLALCDQTERHSLRLAEEAGALVCIGRALYAAMVQDLKQVDQQASNSLSGRHLKDALAQYGGLALALNIEALARDTTSSKLLADLLVLIQDWARRGGDYGPLRQPFLQREIDLKGERALLLPENSTRRNDWSPRPPAPLSYRWEKVQAFLDQLARAA